MTYDRALGEYTLSTGKRVSVSDGIAHRVWEPRELSPAERAEMAAYAIEQWSKWAREQ